MDRIRELLTGYIGDDTSDAAIELLEAFDDAANAAADASNWEEKYNQLDADWRKRYIARFKGESNEEPEQNENNSGNEEKRPEDIDIADVIGEKE